MIRYIIQAVLEVLHFDMVLVGILETEVRYSYSDRKVYFYLYETRWGTRHVKIHVTSRIDSAGNCKDSDPFDKMGVRRNARQTELYRINIKSWLRGRPLTKIPTYRQVKGGKWDFKKLLKGETPFVLNDDEA